MRGGSVAKPVYLYDPRTNITTVTTNAELGGISGLSASSLSRARSNRRKVLGSYAFNEPPSLKVRRELYEKEVFQDEAWVTIYESDNQFQVSNYGRFKRIYKTTTRFLLPFLHKRNGHLYIKVKFKGKYKNHKISHIVAHHFHGPNKKGYSVRHKNGIKTDCFAGNLEYISKEKLGRKTGQLAGSKPVVQVDPHTYEIIDEFRSAREAGRQLYMSYQTVLDNCNGKTRLAFGEYKFMFLEDYEEEVIA